MNYIKFVRILFFVLIVVGVGFLVTQKIWVPKVVEPKVVEMILQADTQKQLIPVILEINNKSFSKINQNETSCDSVDWHLEWDDMHDLLGGIKIFICEEEVLLKIRNQGEQNERTYKGVISTETASDIFTIAESITQILVTELPKLPDPLLPDSSIVKLYFERGGDGSGYRLFFNDKKDEIQSFFVNIFESNDNKFIYHLLSNDKKDEIQSFYEKLQKIRSQIEK